MTTLYNDSDPKACDWMRALMAEGLIAPGTVDERPIEQLTGADLAGVTRFHAFAGIAGWDYALQLAGWPTDRPVWTASLPCQAWSAAGQQKGTADSRHVWPTYFRLIRQLKPQLIFGEQVPAAIGLGWLDGIFTDLESEGYACGATVLASASVGAPNIRQRLYWLADSEHAQRWPLNIPGQNGCDRKDAGREEAYSEPGTCGEVQRLEYAEINRHQRRSISADRGAPKRIAETNFWANSTWHPCSDGKQRRIPAQSVFQRMVDGLPAGLDLCGAESGFPLARKIPGRAALLKGYGNSINPHVATTFIRGYLDLTHF